VVYTNTNLNFRTGNSTDFPSLGLLEKYETLRVIGEYNGWYFVMTNDYNFGFVSANYTTILEDRYVIVDKSEQQLYLYDDNELLYTTPVTTGKDETPSDTGLFEISYKATNVTLSDNKTYWSPVRYWMPYNGGEGLHDADWRSVFGTESYHYGGSHGCINMPVDITDEIYNNVEAGTKVLVHK
jgi:lipoprotein-anchoring transpeptidase ErfK/SrfK